MKRTQVAQAVFLSLVTLAFVACSSDSDVSDRRPRSYPAAGGERAGGLARAGDGLEMMPPADWWRDPQMSTAVALTPDQVASLDKISHDQSEEIAKLERDSMVAARELRETIDASQPSVADITSAAQRLRGIRDASFDHRVQLFAAERTLLSQTQWQALQNAITAARNRSDDRGNYGGRRGRGGMGGGRGRFPG